MSAHRLELLGSTRREPVIVIVVTCREFFQPQSQIGTFAKAKRLVGHDTGDNQQRKRDLGVSIIATGWNRLVVVTALTSRALGGDISLSALQEEAFTRPL